MMNYTFSKPFEQLKPSAIREIFKSLGTAGAISFAAGNPAPESFPVKELSALAAEIFESEPTTALQYGVTEGYTPLRTLIEQRLQSKFAIDTENNMTIVTSGGQQAIELLCKVLCNPGDVVLCENPSFIGALNAFRSLGARPVGVEMEADGICVEALENALKTTKNVKMLYLIPTFHNPTGITMSAEKRRAVYELAQRYNVIILEDNPYGELRFAGEEIPTFKSMDTDGRVIYCGSFSKVLSAGMRIGFACGNEAIIQKMVVAKQVEDVHTNQFFQMLCTRYLQTCDLDGHIKSIQALYRQKCGEMLTALEQYMPTCVDYTRPQGGLFLWCTLPKQLPMMDVVKAAAEQKVFVVAGTAFNCDTEAPSNAFRLNYSMPSAEEIDKGIAILSDVIRKKL